jgi:hypothetical protein
MRVPRDTLTESGDACAHLRELGARTIVVDVEPLVADWNSDQAALDAGLRRFLALVGGLDAVVLFATNSRRRPSPSPEGGPGPRPHYLASAVKPLRTRAYRGLPRPGVVLGDQVATDGLLAWRLGYAFLHYRPPGPVPLGTALMRLVGRPLEPLLFTATAGGN